jgi:hypothetical protein
MLNYQEMTGFLGEYLDKFRDCYYQSTAILGLLDFVKKKGIGRAIEEWDYQSLPQTGIGRPKQADLTIVNGGVLKTLIEVQVAYDRPYDARRLIYDLIKLESVGSGNEIARLLVIVGSTGAYRKHFLHDCTHGRIPAHLSLLPFKLGEKRKFELTKSLPYAPQLLSEYSSKLRTGIPKTITTTLVGDYSSPYINVGVWEVNRPRRRELLPGNFFLEQKPITAIPGFAII